MTKAKNKSAATLVKSNYSALEINTKAACVTAAAYLVSNPAHAFAATPQNVMGLANVFYNFVMGIDAPAQEAKPADVNVPNAPTYA